MHMCVLSTTQTRHQNYALMHMSLAKPDRHNLNVPLQTAANFFFINKVIAPFRLRVRRASPSDSPICTTFHSGSRAGWAHRSFFGRAPTSTTIKKQGRPNRVWECVLNTVRSREMDQNERSERTGRFGLYLSRVCAWQPIQYNRL